MDALQHSQDFFFQDGTHVFRHGNTVYRLHQSILERNAGVFNNMFKLPFDGAAEGTLDHPILVPGGISSLEWEHLLRFTYGPPPPFTLDFLLGLLKMSTMWDIPPARAFAISELVEKAKAYTAEFPPFLRFHIGVCFQVEELVLPAFSTLVCRDPWACGTLNVVPHDQLRYELVELVIRTRSLLEAERCRLATIPPPAQMATMCTSHDLCGQLWEHAWVFQIGRLLVHPDRVFRLSFYDGPEKVQELRIPRMNQACLNLTKEVVATGEAFDFETIITRKILLKEGFIQ